MKNALRWFSPAQFRLRMPKGVLGKSGSKKIESKSGINPLIALHGFGQAEWCDHGYESLVREGYLKNPVVYRCVRMIAEAAGSVNWLLYDGDQEMDEHPLLDLLRMPNAHQAGQEFLEQAFVNLLVSGEAYVQRINLDTEVSELHLLRSDRVQPVVDEQGWPIAYDYSVNGTTVRFEVDELTQPVLQIRMYNPIGDFRGYSPLGAAHMAMDIHNASSRWNKALLDNSARPSGALVYSTNDNANLTDEQFQRLKSELEDGYTGASRAGRPMLLEGGLDWKAMGISPKDMDFMQARYGAARDIALAFGVPPMLLGIPGDNTYANYQEANRAFWRQTILPLVTRVGGSLQRWLGSNWSSGLRLDIDKDKIDALAVDRQSLWARINEADFLTRNEKRHATGYGELPVDGN